MAADEILVGLVEHYSPSGKEQDAAEYLCLQMLKLGYTKSYLDEAGNAVGIMGEGPHQVILLSHIDTVPGKIPFRIDQNTLYGRGAVDAKASLACFVHAVARVGEVPGWQWVVIAAVGEEKDSVGSRYIINRYYPEATIIGEPNHWNRIALGYKGSARVTLTFRQRRIHSARQESSACETAIGTWQKIKEMAIQYNLEKPKIFDQLQVSLLKFNTGEKHFEDSAKLTLGARLPVGFPPEDLQNWLIPLAQNSEIFLHPFPIPAWRGDKNNFLVRTFLKSIRTFGGDPQFVYKTGTADVNLVAPAWKCPCLVYGPGDSAFDHTPDEHIDLDEYNRSIAIVQEVLRLFSTSEIVPPPGYSSASFPSTPGTLL